MAHRFIIDVSKAALALVYNGANSNGHHLIRDTHAVGDDAVVAICPLHDVVVSEGQHSFAPLVQAALEAYHTEKADFAKLYGLVQQAFHDGRESMSGTDKHHGGRAWENSRARARLQELKHGKSNDVMPVHPMGDHEIMNSPTSSPVERMAAHGRMAQKGEI